MLTQHRASLSRQNGIGAVSPNGNGTGRYPVDTRAEIASISASIDAEEEEAALQAMRDAERDAEGEDAFWSIPFGTRWMER